MKKGSGRGGGGQMDEEVQKLVEKIDSLKLPEEALKIVEAEIKKVQ
jgi:ATP-dependent Lon protease